MENKAALKRILTLHPMCCKPAFTILIIIKNHLGSCCIILLLNRDGTS